MASSPPGPDGPGVIKQVIRPWLGRLSAARRRNAEPTTNRSCAAQAWGRAAHLEAEPRTYPGQADHGGVNPRGTDAAFRPRLRRRRQLGGRDSAIEYLPGMALANDASLTRPN